LGRGLNTVESFPEEDFIELVKNSSSYSECLRGLGLSTNGGRSSVTLKRRIVDLRLSVEHFKAKGSWVKSRLLEDILVENSDYTNFTKLKSRISKELSLGVSCQECGIGCEWNGKKLVLQLDHINGIKSDNRLENLRFLCPNCHSQTDTYAGKNK
jgi:Zn finger protein HypA/HybF involved in hydrogenase expression